jgi:hypothetical protein
MCIEYKRHFIYIHNAIQFKNRKSKGEKSEQKENREQLCVIYKNF